MTFSQQIKQARERLGLTQAQAAALLEISKSTLEKWEAGSETPKPLMQEGALARLKNATPKNPKPARRKEKGTK